jgi:hypothetical protein
VASLVIAITEAICDLSLGTKYATAGYVPLKVAENMWTSPWLLQKSLDQRETKNFKIVSIFLLWSTHLNAIDSSNRESR